MFVHIVRSPGRDKNDAISRVLRARTTRQRSVVVGQIGGRDMVNLDKPPVRQADHHARLARHSPQRLGQLGNDETASHDCNLLTLVDGDRRFASSSIVHVLSSASRAGYWLAAPCWQGRVVYSIIKALIEPGRAGSRRRKGSYS